MRRETFLNGVRMLILQLNEEEANYNEVLAGKRKFTELKQINQRINSLKQLLFSLEKTAVRVENPKAFHPELF